MALPNLDLVYTGTFEETQVRFDQKILTFAGTLDSYHSLRQELKKKGLKLPYVPSRSYSVNENENETKYQEVSLADLTLWEIYVLAEALNLVEREEKLSDILIKELTASLVTKKDAKNYNVPSRGITEYTPVEQKELVNILFDAPLEEDGRPKRLTKLRETQLNFWKQLSSKKSSDSNGIKSELFSIINQYLNLHSVNKLTKKRARILAQLTSLIDETDENNLRHELNNFLNGFYFRTGLLGRSRLRKMLLKAFDKPITINPLHLDQMPAGDDKTTLLEFLKNQPHGTRISRKRYYNFGKKVFKFSHSIEVAESQESQKSYFICRPDRKLLGEGGFGRVKKMLGRFSINEANTIESHNEQWVIKKLKRLEKLRKDQRVPRNYTQEEVKQSAEHEVAATQAAAPELEAQKLILRKKDTTLREIMRNAGKALNSKKLKNLTAEDIAKILYDAARHAQSAHNAGYVMMDIKPDNIVYDPIRGKATIIDHSGTIAHEAALRNHNKASLAPEICTKGAQIAVDYNQIHSTRFPFLHPEITAAESQPAMVYALGISLIYLLGHQFNVSPEILNPNDENYDTNLSSIWWKYFGGEFSQFSELSQEMLKESPQERTTLDDLINRLAHLCQNHRGSILEKIEAFKQSVNNINRQDEFASYQSLFLSQLLTAIEDYIISVKKLSPKRANNCLYLIELIEKTDISKLEDQVKEYFESPQFHRGLLRRSQLKNNVLKSIGKERENLQRQLQSLQQRLAEKIALAQNINNPDIQAKINLIAANIANPANFTFEQLNGYYQFIQALEGNNSAEYLQKLNLFYPRRHSLADSVLCALHLIDACNLNNVQEEKKVPLLRWLQSQDIGTKIKRDKIYRIKGQIFVFSHSIEIAESQNGKKRFFALKRKDGSEMEGSLGLVKRALRYNSDLKLSTNSWVTKKIKNQDPYAQQNFKNSVQHEVDMTTTAAANLKIHRANFFPRAENLSHAKLYMKYAGENLDNLRQKFEGDSQQPTPALIKTILWDVTSQAQEAAGKNLFIADIKPLNICFDEQRNEAIIIDHNGTINQGSHDFLHYTPSYLPPEFENIVRANQSADWDLTEKIMVFAIGMSLAEFMVGKDILGAKRSGSSGGAPTSWLIQEPNHVALNAFQDDDELKQLIRSMIDMDAANRPTLAEVIERLGARPESNQQRIPSQ